MNPIVFLAILAIVFASSAVLAHRAIVAVAAPGPEGKPWHLLSSFPSTNGRIVVELVLAVLFVVGCMVADMIARPVSEGTQETLGLFIAAMLGIGAGQFFGKRKTDEKHLAGIAAIEAAKSSPSATTVNAGDAAKVEVNQPAAGG